MSSTSVSWIEEPTILFQRDKVFEMWPFDNMNYNAKINAITRIIIVLTFVGYIITESMYIVLVCLIAMGAIYKMVGWHQVNETKSSSSRTLNNPYNNVLLTDIGNGNTSKKANAKVNKPLSSSSPSELSDGTKNLWDIEQDKYLDHIFYSTINPGGMNDQEGFANFLYGGMPSAKEDGAEAASMRVKHNERYRLY